MESAIGMKWNGDRHGPESALTATCIWLVCLLGGHSAASLSGQDTIAVSGEVTCGACAITLDTVLTIGGLDGPGLHQVSHYADVAVDRRGRVYVADFMQPEVAVFDSGGEYLRTLGGRGEGPGEYGTVLHINIGPRYIHILDRNRGRTVLDYDFNVVATHRFPGLVYEAFVTDADEVAWIGDVPLPASVDLELHVLGLSGEIASFGVDRDVYPGRDRPTSAVVTGDAETLWVVERSNNRLTRWDVKEEPMVGAVFDRTVEEFVNANPGGGWPSTVHAGVMLDDSGLWIVWNARDPEWAGRPRSSGSQGPQRVPQVPPRKTWDGWVELVDPSTGRTLARHRNDGFLSGVAHGSGYLVGHYETDAGVPYIHLLQPRIAGWPTPLAGRG